MQHHRIIALSGGVGGAKLALGLSRVLPPGDLAVIANTGDDFEHLGLSISPDIDTLLYALAGLDNQATGWGRRDESWNFMASLEALGGETWFNLGDRDLATHIERTRRLRGGESLSQITDDFRRRFDIGATILPMSDDPVRTRVKTKDGWLDFQPYFVRQRCEPVITAIEFAGAADARPQPALLAALGDPALGAVILCPSNPFISIEPILALRGVRAALRDCAAPVIAVSPIIGGRAVKGPTAKMMQELGLEISAAAVARRYGDLIDAYIVDHADALSCASLECAVVPANALMETLADREALARVVLDAAARVLEPAQ
ncbi:MAG TPA: 2-phospho-L-lactate transferase [Stellaceae bacterium]|jgi:LPPG:FO 2-phospho-L-lactate transferase|nr:2-phospho-L-lactate transferase [Stellaceae bacterium]